MDDWEAYDNNYPAGMPVNLALPFFRDSKLRVAGLAGVWESALAEPEYIDGANIRNPKVVLGNPGVYSVNFTVVQNGQTYTKDMPDMNTATTCPSIEDCNNPAEVPKDIWVLLYVDSQETNYPGLGNACGHR
ncbi:MAG: hypothetical protein B6D64_02250 [Bacteroidetes bacterium 4484_276]|nr:MAG: hypothetical protein B6D64_02250 [Bacteroidetes bacterium 4484_276]OYT14115.1 MAG: hypothetical protein B6I19_01590 [Bacteroidetes bacterium 4572_114]